MPARYLMAEPLVAAGSQAIVAGEKTFAVDGMCESRAPRRYKGTRKGTTVRAMWPACTGLAGTVKLAGKIADDRSTFRGTLRARRFKRRIVAMRSSCGEASSTATARRSATRRRRARAVRRAVTPPRP